MKKTLAVSGAAFAMGILTLSQIAVGMQVADRVNTTPTRGSVTVLQTLAPQEIAPPTPPVGGIQGSPSDQAGTLVTPDSVLQSPPIVDGSITEVPTMDGYQPAWSGVGGLPATRCDRCCQNQCCCPVTLDLCLVEPNCGCRYDICVEVPACCAGEAPQVSWRNGILGRQIAWLCWPCCKKRIKVVIRANGEAKVWD